MTVGVRPIRQGACDAGVPRTLRRTAPPGLLPARCCPHVVSQRHLALDDGPRWFVSGTAAVGCSAAALTSMPTSSASVIRALIQSAKSPRPPADVTCSAGSPNRNGGPTSNSSPAGTRGRANLGNPRSAATTLRVFSSTDCSFPTSTMPRGRARPPESPGQTPTRLSSEIRATGVQEGPRNHIS